MKKNCAVWMIAFSLSALIMLAGCSTEEAAMGEPVSPTTASGSMLPPSSPPEASVSPQPSVSVAPAAATAPAVTAVPAASVAAAATAVPSPPTAPSTAPVASAASIPESASANPAQSLEQPSGTSKPADQATASPPIAAKGTAETFIGKSLTTLISALGEPDSSSYANSCLGEGDDGELYYKGFTVYTYREGSVEEVTAVE